MRCKIWGVVLLPLCGCSVQNITIRVPRPAKVDLAAFGAIGVLDFTGTSGRELANDVTAQLASTHRFQLVDRRNFAQVEAELNRQRNELWDPDTLARLGKQAGAAVLIQANVSAHEYKEDMQSEEGRPGSDGKVPVYNTRIGKATVTAYIQATRVETAEIVYSETLSAIEQARTSAVNSEPQPIDGNQLLLRARLRVAENFRLQVAPHEQTIVVPLFTDGDLPELKRGNVYAQTGSWPRALEEYERAGEAIAARQLQAYRYKVLYNQGVALTYLNRFAEARDKLTEGSVEYELNASLGSNRSMFEAQLGRLKERESEFAALREQIGTPKGGGNNPLER